MRQYERLQANFKGLILLMQSPHAYSRICLQGALLTARDHCNTVYMLYSTELDKCYRTHCALLVLKFQNPISSNNLSVPNDKCQCNVCDVSTFSPQPFKTISNLGPLKYCTKVR